MTDDTEYIKLPLIQRCTHKLWKARVHGYAEAAKQFQEEDEKSQFFNQFLGLVAKFVSDSNAVAQEKGLEATLHFVQNASVAGKTVKDVMGAIIAKSIAAPKKSTQELSMQIALMYIEIEKQEAVVEELLKGLEHKNPKIVAACLTTVTAGLRDFGAQVVSVKPLVKPMLALLEDRDKAVRDETKALVVEVFRWIGDAIRPQLSKLKPVQLNDLEEAFVKVKSERAVPVRYLRSQQAKVAKIAAEGGEDYVDDGGQPVDEVEVDPLSLVEPINVLTKIPSGFYEKIEAKKWQDRKEAVEALDKVLDYPKFEKADYGDLVRALMKIVSKDSNVVVVGIATKCVARLASGLKKGFHPYASATLPQLLAKFKEKKANVVTPLREAVDAVYPSTSLEAMQEDVILFLDNKNPAIKAETAAFLGRCFAQSTAAVLNKKLLKPLVGALLKTLNEPDPVVRDCSAEALGIAMKVVGEKNLMPFLPEIDALKLAKIKECCEKAVVKAPQLAPKPKPEPVKPEPKKVLSAGAVAAKAVPKPAVVKPVEEEEEEEEEKKPVGRVDISAKITEQLLSELNDKNWKTRNDALVAIQAMITDTKIKSNLGELPVLLVQRFVDTNSKLALTALEVCTGLATAMGPGSKNHVRSFARGIFNALGDNKQWVRAAALTCLNTWTAEAGAKEFFQGEIIPDTLKTASPTLKIELWTWLCDVLVQNKSLPKEEISFIVPYLFHGLEDRNAEVRKVANNAVFGIMSHVGYAAMTKEVEKLKPASKSGIMAVLDKVRPDVPELETKRKADAKPGKTPNPVPPKSAPISKSRTSIAPKAVPKKKEEEVDSSPLLLVNKMKNQRVLDEQKLKILKWNFTTPRAEFVELLKDQVTVAGFNKNLIANMFHTDFKFHIKAIESLSEDLTNVDALIANFDLILKWLSLRFFDTNPSVLLKGLEYLQTAMSILIDREYQVFDVEANSFIPYLVMKIGDPKDAVRDRVHSILRQFSLMFAPGKLFLLILDGIKSKNSRLRTECLDELGYLIEQFGTGVCQPSLAAALKEISKQISDRDNSVRSAALNAIVKAYFVDGEKILKLIGRLSDKDMSYLEERIKRASQNRTKMADMTRVEKKKPEPEVVETYEDPVEVEPEMPVEPIPKADEPVGRPSDYPPEMFVFKPFDIPPTRVKKCQLIEIDDSFLDEPVYIPESIRMKMQKPVPANPLFEEVLQNASSPDIAIAVNGTKKLHAVLQAEDIEDKLEPFASQILDALITQLELANLYTFAQHGQTLGTLYRAIFRNIDDIFSKLTVIGKQADENHLKALIQQLLIAFVEDKTVAFQEGGFNSFITIYLTRIIENSDATNLACGIVNALYDLVASPPANPKLTDLTTKCMLKFVLRIRRSSDLDALLNLDRVLYTCHLFMQAYPRYSWKDRPSDLPLKAVKTFLMELVTKKGPEILRHMTKVENAVSSELACYLKKMIKSLPNAKGSGTKLTQTMSLHLSEIFNKIGSEGNGTEGMIQLYEFRKQHPDVDLTPILAPTTPFFQEYVADGLRQIEKERGPLKKALNFAPPAPPKSDNPVIAVGDQVPPTDPRLLPDYYMNRLRAWQQRLGMPLSSFADMPPVDAKYE